MPATSAENRDQVIIRTSIIGILTNVFLAAFKAVIGILSHSIAVTLDAILKILCERTACLTGGLYCGMY